MRIDHMSKKKNKVRFGLKNCYYAKATFDEDGNVTYDTPKRLPGAVSIGLDPEGESENFYADDISDLDLVTMGTVYDMINESNRDSIEWREQATQADMDRI